MTVTEYQFGARTCAGCEVVTCAPWSAAVPRGVVGPRLAAAIALLTGRYRLSKREVVACLDDLLGADLALGTVSAVEQQVSAALEPVARVRPREARAAAQQAAVANLACPAPTPVEGRPAETGWRQGRQRAWLSRVRPRLPSRGGPPMVTERLTVFQIDRSRSQAVAEALLGPDWDGIVGSDRSSAYRWLGSARRQVCWAHLRRDFQKLVDWGPGPRPVGEQALAVQAQVFVRWQRFQRGELERPALAAAATDGHPVAAALARQVLLVWPAV